MQINTKLPLGAAFSDFKSSEQDLLVCLMFEGHIERRHRCCVPCRIYFWISLGLSYLPCRWWRLGGDSVWNHYFFFCCFFFLDNVLFVRISIFVSWNLSFIVNPSIYNILLLLVAGESPSSWPVLVGILLNYIIAIKVQAYLLWRELEMNLPCSNVYDGFGSVEEWSS